MSGSLEEFFVERFSSPDLRRCLALLPEGVKLVASLPGEQAGHRLHVDAAMNLLHQHRSLDSPALYYAIVGERPRFLDVIDRFARERGVALDWKRQCEVWRSRGQTETAAIVFELLLTLEPPPTEDLARQKSLEIAALRAVHRTGALLPRVGPLRPAGAAAAVEAQASGRLDWTEQSRQEIRAQVMNLEGEVAAMRMSDLAMECDALQNGRCMLVARMRTWYMRRGDAAPDREDLAELQALLAEVLAETDKIIEDYRRALKALHPPADGVRADAGATPAVGSAAVVRCVGVGKTYEPSKPVLRAVSFELMPGTLTGLVGPNGAGKSTLLRILCGAIAHGPGELTYPALGVEGARRDWRAIKREIRYISQRPPRWPGRLIDNLRAWAAHLGLHGTDNEKEIEHVVERLGLAAHRDKTWDELSGGFRIRFEVARARLGTARLLVLDEPLAMLDPRTQHRVLEVLQAFTRPPRRASVILSSQNVREIEPWVDHVLCLDATGAVIYTGAPGRIGEGSSHRVFEIPRAAIERVADAIHGIEGCAVQASDGVAFVSVRSPVSEAELTRILAHLQVGLQLEYMWEITSSVRRLLWGGGSDGS